MTTQAILYVDPGGLVIRAGDKLQVTAGNLWNNDRIIRTTQDAIDAVRYVDRMDPPYRYRIVDCGGSTIYH